MMTLVKIFKYGSVCKKKKKVASQNKGNKNLEYGKLGYE